MHAKHSPPSPPRPTFGARLLWPLHRAIWATPQRRARKLLQFAEVEAEGARDLYRAAEVTSDPVLRRRLFAHAREEARHADQFRSRGLAIRRDLTPFRSGRGISDALGSGEHGFDDLPVAHENAPELLAFIHLSESAAAREFATYCSVLDADPETRAVLEAIGRDEMSHMRYSLAELERVAPGQARRTLWAARLRRLWQGYLRIATLIANAFATVLLTLQYFILLPPFALLAKRSAGREALGWTRRKAETLAPAGREF
jgi:rubrerythrin